jgi:hypothetical protein
MKLYLRWPEDILGKPQNSMVWNTLFPRAAMNLEKICQFSDEATVLSTKSIGVNQSSEGYAYYVYTDTVILGNY